MSIKEIIYDQALRGNCFTYTNYLSYTIGESKSFVFDPSRATEKDVQLLPIQVVTTGGPFELKLYSSTASLDDGTVLSANSSKDRKSARTPDSVLRLNPTITTPGTNFFGGLILNSQPWMSNKIDLIIDIDITVKYRIEIINSSGAAAKAQLSLTWMEMSELGF